METVNAIIALVQNVGIPGTLLIGGGAFLWRRAWPDMIEVGKMMIAAVEALAIAQTSMANALIALAEKLPDLSPDK